VKQDMANEREPDPDARTMQAAPPSTFRAEMPISAMIPRARFAPRPGYRELQDVIASIESCEEAGHGREITAVLRITREQTQARDMFTRTVVASRVVKVLFLVSTTAFFLAISRDRTTGGPFVFLLFALIFLIAMIANRSVLHRARFVVNLYERECDEIDSKAAALICRCTEPTQTPRRMYSDDLKELDRLARKHPQLRSIAKRLKAGPLELSHGDS
jgi:hypothetical protein